MDKKDNEINVADPDNVAEDIHRSDSSRDEQGRKLYQRFDSRGIPQRIWAHSAIEAGEQLREIEEGYRV